MSPRTSFRSKCREYAETLAWILKWMLIYVFCDGVLTCLVFMGAWIGTRYWGQFTVGGNATPLRIGQFFWWCWTENGFASPIDIKPLNLIATLSVILIKL